MTINNQIQAPLFTAAAIPNSTISLVTYLESGKTVILYFYPRDNTPGCTQESIDFRDNYATFQANNIEIIGISRDTIKSHQKFADKYQLPFTLIADTDSVICNLYQVLKEKNMYGKKVIGIERSTFIISPTGSIIHEWRKVKVPGHIETVLATTKLL